jgi:sulfite reductase (ferredoxin)
MPIALDEHIDKKAQKDILELESKITGFQAGEISDEKFRSFRLTRGVYGQRQLGVQMIRIKLPFGKLTSEQLIRIADVCDEFASGILHATTRQDIQIHHVKLVNTPKVWAKLEEKSITLREACGNTVRNVTASAYAGIDRDELFDVSPYADAFYEYFLRNPICQDMGRKFKVAFSSSSSDTAYTFIHDLGFIPKIKLENGKEVRGFKVVIAGGLGAQAILAQKVTDFLPVDEFIPFSEAVIRVFDRYGERTRRHKARLKYLIADIGLAEFLKLVEEEHNAIKNKKYIIDTTKGEKIVFPSTTEWPLVEVANAKKYEEWRKTNTYEQKQAGYFAVNVKLPLGNLSTDIARKFAAIAKKYAADDIRITVNQGYLLKYLKPSALPHLFNALDELGLAEPGSDSTADITACPGTDTCNLGIASSYGLSLELERLIREEFHDLIYNNDIKIKISGCMNACGQHSLANIGFHGMSLKVGEAVIPAMQILLGGGPLGDGEGAISEKIIKLPSKRVPDAFRYLMHDYEANGLDGEYFNAYFERQGKNYFYQLLKPLGSLDTISPDFFVDWGNTDQYVTEVGVGECASVILDLVQVLINETSDKLSYSLETLNEGSWADSIYHSYNTFISGAKTLLLTKDIQCNTQHGVISDFQKNFVETGEFDQTIDFKSLVLQINQNEPNASFAKSYHEEAKKFLSYVVSYRKNKVVESILN